MPVVCRFKLLDALDREAVEAQLALAIVSAECVFGQAKVRITAAYLISPVCEAGNNRKGFQVAVDVSTPVGEHIAEVFTGLITRQFGEDGFTVDRVDNIGTRKEPLVDERQ